MINDFKVITLCGSTKFKDDFLAEQKRLTLEGNIVISVGLFGHSGDNEVWTEGTKEMLDKMHKSKIDLADEIFVINKNGYIGSSTKSEIEHAIKTNKRIRFMEPREESLVTLETERLILRNYKPSDLENYFEYVSMENVGPRCGWEPYTDKQKAKARLELESTKPHQFAITLKGTDKVIGSVELMNAKNDRYGQFEIAENAKEIGFLLSNKYWGQGIMPEAAKAVMKYAFEVLEVPEIFISHAEANLQSGRVQEKLGFKIIGKNKNYRKWTDGNPTDAILRKMTKAEWLEISK